MLLTHKKVNVISKKGLPLYFLKINSSMVYNIILSLSDIVTAIQMGCIVEEETKKGKIILDINNFHRDFNTSYIDEDNTKSISTEIDLRPVELKVSDNDIKNEKKETTNSLINRLIGEQNIIKNNKYR